MAGSILEGMPGGTVGFFGLGRSNLALMRMMSDRSKIILRSDQKIRQDDIPRDVKIAEIFDGDDAAKHIREDFLVFSPSVRRDRSEFSNAARRGCVFTSDFEIFLAGNEKPLFLVTGSDGKTTTTTLISLILGIPAIGNIGEPMTPHLFDGADAFAVEASSFMLEYAAPKSRRGAITSLTENHLNWHHNLADYKRAKLRAIEGAEEAVITADSHLLTVEDLPKKVFAVCGADGGELVLSRRLSAELCYSVKDGYILKNGRRIIATSDLLRNEKYNLKNYLTALAMTDGFVAEDRAIEVIRSFGGVAHRGERLGQINGIEFINSSIDTTPARCAATLEDLPEGIIILLGGRDKGLDFTSLGEIIKRRGDRAIAFGEAEEKIASAIEGCLKAGGGLREAVTFAAKIARDKDTVLLSPAATSFDEFSGFEERGEAFKSLVFQVF